MLAVLVVATVLSGCSRGCDDMGVLSGVSFDLGSTPGIVRASACVESRCAAFDRIPQDDGPPLLLRTRGVTVDVDAERDVQTRLTVVDAAGRKRTFRTVVRMRASEPNGTGCGTAYGADVRLAGGRLGPR